MLINRQTIFKSFGPGLIVAAAGIGAGDVITSTVTGSQFGLSLCWALVVCVLLKYFLNEGIARWQLATGSTIIQACVERLPRVISILFLGYLIIWTFFVGGSLTNACGVAGYSLFPVVPVWTWGIVHSVVAVALVLLGKYTFFENVMKTLVGLMVLTVIGCAILIMPNLGELFTQLVFADVTRDSRKAMLSIFGGIGGSMTMLCYGYWMREAHLSDVKSRKTVKIDLAIAYTLTLAFALGLTVIAAQCNATVIQGSGMALEVASRLEAILGQTGKWAFLIGFWCAVFSSTLAVWQGVPYMFADFVKHYSKGSIRSSDLKSSNAYRGFLFFIAGPPLVLLYAGQPIAMVSLFTIVGSLFMPFLAALLLYLNNRHASVGSMQNGVVSNLVLLVSLLTFGWIAASEFMSFAS